MFLKFYRLLCYQKYLKTMLIHHLCTDIILQQLLDNIFFVVLISQMVNGPCCCLAAQSCLTFVTSWTAAHQTPLFIDLPGKNTGVGYHFLLQVNGTSPGELQIIFQVARFTISSFKFFNIDLNFLIVLISPSPILPSLREY